MIFKCYRNLSVAVSHNPNFDCIFECPIQYCCLLELFFHILGNELLVTTIAYKTSDQVVKANSTITIECLATHSKLMHIVKEINGRLQVLNTTLGNFANYTIKMFDTSNTGIYLCEAIGQHITREYIRLDIGG